MSESDQGIVEKIAKQISAENRDFTYQEVLEICKQELLESTARSLVTEFLENGKDTAEFMALLEKLAALLGNV